MCTRICTTKFVTVVALAGMAFAAGESRKDLRFKVGKRPVISINNPYGPVIVKAGAPHQVVVSAILHSDKVELDQSKSHNRVDVVSHLLAGADQNTGLVEYNVEVPADANVTVHSENGRIHAEKIQGDVTVAGNEGPIDVTDCGGGHVHVRTLNGSVSLNNVHGHVEIMSMGGDVLMNEVTGALVAVNSNSGRIRYAGDFGDEGEYDFTSHTGDIEAIAPAFASIDVLARSDQGRVDSDFSLEPRHTPFTAKVGSAFHGTLNMAGSSVHLISFSGKIHLKKRQN